MKFAHPFGSGTFWITQTYHTGAGNRAIDAVWDTHTNSLKQVFAVGDGVLGNYHTSGGSYASLDLDDSDIRALYVHCYQWTVPAGTHVKKGQHIGNIAPSSVNGGYPEHGHFGLQYKSGIGYPNIMDYMDRSIQYDTQYQAIKDVWWSNGSINWNLFQDLSYTNTPDKPRPDLKIDDKIKTTAPTDLKKGNGFGYETYGQVPTDSEGVVINNDIRWTDDHWWVGVYFDVPQVSKKDGWMIADDLVKLDPTPPPVDDCDDIEEKLDAANQTIEAQEGIIGELELENQVLERANEGLMDDRQRLVACATGMDSIIKEYSEEGK